MMTMRVTLLLLLATLPPSLSHKTLRKHDRLEYLIVFDAGSTGTRAHFYTLRHEPQTVAGYAIESSVSFSSKGGGLSSFANQPERAGDKVRRLLLSVKIHVPKDEWYRAWVIVRATAGMRLLNSFSRRRIFKSVEDTLIRSPFRIPTEIRPVRLISGQEEAKYGWIMLNFLIDRLQSGSAVLLEMGGGSLQVAFRTNSESETFSTFNFSVHAHSYLGLGASQALLSHINFKGGHEFYKSKCVAANTVFNFTFGTSTATIRGENIDDNLRGSECLNEAKWLIKQKAVHDESKLIASANKIYCLSAPYYQLKWIKSGNYGNVTKTYCKFDDNCKSYNTTVGSLRQSITKLCSKMPKFGTYEPYYCLQTSVLSSFISEGVNIDNSVQLVAFKSKLSSWTLGFALEFVNSDFVESDFRQSSQCVTLHSGLVLMPVIAFLLF